MIVGRSKCVYEHVLRSKDVQLLLVASCHNDGARFHCGQGLVANDSLGGCATSLKQQR